MRTLAFAATLVATACGYGADDLGSADLGIELPDGSTVGSVSYRIEGSGIEPIEGHILVGDEPGRRVSAAIDGIPAGAGYNLTLVAAATDEPDVNCTYATSASRRWSGILYEAEDRTAESGCFERSVHQGYTGRGFMDFGGGDTWIEWDNIYAPEAGTYTLVFRYAVSRSRDRRSAIRINGRYAGDVLFTRTGPGWTAWGEADIAVELERGDNTVRVRALTDRGGPNLDHMIAVVGEDDRCEWCEGESSFDVVGGAVTAVSLQLNCREGDGSEGGVVVDAGFNHCPALGALTTTPVQVVVGESINVTASASDADGDDLAYEWTSTSGSFTNAVEPATSYRCEEAGEQTLVARVSDGSCLDTKEIDVVCLAP